MLVSDPCFAQEEKPGQAGRERNVHVLGESGGAEKQINGAEAVHLNKYSTGRNADI